MAIQQFFPIDKKRCMQNTGINVQLMGKELMHLRLQPGFVVEDGLKSCILRYNNFNGIQGKGCMGGDAEGRGWWEGQSAFD